MTQDQFFPILRSGKRKEIDWDRINRGIVPVCIRNLEKGIAGGYVRTGCGLGIWEYCQFEWYEYVFDYRFFIRSRSILISADTAIWRSESAGY